MATSQIEPNIEQTVSAMNARRAHSRILNIPRPTAIENTPKAHMSSPVITNSKSAMPPLDGSNIPNRKEDAINQTEKTVIALPARIANDPSMCTPSNGRLLTAHHLSLTADYLPPTAYRLPLPCTFHFKYASMNGLMLQVSQVSIGLLAALGNFEDQHQLVSIEYRIDHTPASDPNSINRPLEFDAPTWTRIITERPNRAIQLSEEYVRRAIEFTLRARAQVDTVGHGYPLSRLAR